MTTYRACPAGAVKNALTSSICYHLKKKTPTGVSERGLHEQNDSTGFGYGHRLSSHEVLPDAGEAVRASAVHSAAAAGQRTCSSLKCQTLCSAGVLPRREERSSAGSTCAAHSLSEILDATWGLLVCTRGTKPHPDAASRWETAPRAAVSFVAAAPSARPAARLRLSFATVLATPAAQ